MHDDPHTILDEPYEKWARVKEPRWPKVRRRIGVALIGGVMGAVLGLLIYGVVWLSSPGQLVWSWGVLGVMALVGAFSAAIQDGSK